MVIVLDTGILLRLVDRGSPMHWTMRAAVRVIKARGDSVSMAVQNVAEFWNVCTRPSTARGGLGLSIAETNHRLRLLERIVPILPDSPAVTESAIDELQHARPGLMVERDWPPDFLLT